MLLPFRAEAQTSSPWIRLGANGLLLYTHANPVPRNQSLGEVRVVQPMLMAQAGAWSNRLRFSGTLDLEGLTIPDGELTLGAWGEGFMDRRHPHTYVHELMLSLEDGLGGWDGSARASLAIGKGFVPFGTDDPMSRPVVRYPINHHLAQILERAMATIGARAGPVTVEASLFNGDEPESPGQWPRLSRFGDSWSGRVTLLPLEQLEVQASYAKVHSPEHRLGSGTDQHKWSVSGRWDGNVGEAPLYGLMEWARTSEAEGFFVFHTFLAEGAWTTGSSRLHYRFERTERAEEERTLSPFQSVRPHTENSVQGITRWTVHTAGYGYRVLHPRAALSVEPFIELTYGRMAEVRGGVFDVRSFYGRESFWSASLGVRMNLGTRAHRMGRYGVAMGSGNGHHNQQQGPHDP